MSNTIKSFFIENEWVSVLLLVIIFVLIRLPGTDLPLHQDEYKWPDIVSPAYTSDIEIPHPPLSDLIYRTAGHIVGYNTNFRFVPLFFGAINLLLLYYFMRMSWGRREAIIASVIWIFSYFSVLASLMVDTDGQIMPFFFLLALIAYYKVRPPNRFSYKWLAILILACVGGFLVKVSFLIAVAALVADFIWMKKGILTRDMLIKYVLYGLGVAVGLAALLILMKYIFPFFSLDRAFEHWGNFIAGNRGWFQTIIQCVKALLYSSPLLVLIPFFIKKGDVARSRPFLFFLIFAFIFYIILFDFSKGALDRYLQLLILPLTVFTSIVISMISKTENRKVRKYIVWAIIASLVLIALQFVYHYVPSLHPKTEWVSRVLSFRWNFVYPFSGGSGPLGFYVSFLFMAISWIISVVALVIGMVKPNFRTAAIFTIIIIGIAYNGVFIEEYLFGRINGSAPKVLSGTVEFIDGNPGIVKVNPYNDNGGNEIKEIGKYGQRLYIDPKFEVNPQEVLDRLNTHKEHYMVVNIPRFNPESIQQRFFDTCRVVYVDSDRKISSIVYDCRNAPNITVTDKPQ